MICKLVKWALLIPLLLYVASFLLHLVPLLLSLTALSIALCAVYALLPPSMRLDRLERWLDPQWEKPVKSPSSPTFPFSPTNPNSNTTTSMPQHLQPQLDFEGITTPRGKLPNREELIAFLSSQVIGQSKAVATLGRAVIGKLAAVNHPKPLVIMLVGSTGTGKTELSKALATALKTTLNRFDMGEYADSFKSSNLMGSAKGYVGSEEGGALPNALRQSKKICLLLFDEVEKANSGLYRQLLAFFDEGRLTDTLGSVVAPKDTICLLTSNLAADKIAQNPNASKDILKQENFFPPEFIGRVDKTIPLLRLNQADSARLTVVLAKRVATRYGITLIIEQEALSFLVDETFEEGDKYGGRGIQEKILDLLSDDFIDLQGSCATQAQLVIEEGRVKATALE